MFRKFLSVHGIRLLRPSVANKGVRLGRKGGGGGEIGKTARRFARFRIKLIGKHCTTGRDGTRNCDEGAVVGRRAEGEGRVKGVDGSARGRGERLVS